MATQFFDAAVQVLLLFVFFYGARSFEKPGTCHVPRFGFGGCVDECQSDDSCPGDEKCCSNDCGHICLMPPELKCPELTCDEHCSAHGYKLDERGCATCECYTPNPCPKFKCRPCSELYNYKNMSDYMCQGCECVSSLQCPRLQCECPEGHKLDTDINGCPTCRCVPEPRCPELSCDYRLY